MRKVDYVNLAKVIKNNVHIADAKNPLKTAEYWAGYGAVLAIVADEFSDIANVKKDEFMRACGLN